MATTIAIRFLFGRYHATPWHRSVNEGAVEWPPSPWRLLRALVATWYTRWPDLPAPELDALLESLGSPPAYLTPPSRPGHSRHYLPDLDHKKGTTGGTDLTLDPFLSVSRSEELLVRWDVDLPIGQREILAKLVELLAYLGRADSVCEARLLDDDPQPDATWWMPATSQDRQALLLVPTRPVSRPALEISTVQARRSRRTLPLGSAFVGYTSGEQKERRSEARPEVAVVEAMRFAVAGNVPLRSGHGVLLADEAHRAAGRLLERHEIGDERRKVLLGTDGARTDHRHVHWIPIAESTRRGAAVTSLVMWAPGRLRSSEVAALIDLPPMSGTRGRRRENGDAYQIQGFPQVQLLFQASGPIEQVAPELCGPAQTWRSLTPYLPVRHRKREPLSEYLTADIAAELGYRELCEDVPLPVVAAIESDGRMPDRWAQEFRRYRLSERMAKSRAGLGLRLEFDRPIHGPLLIGQLSHFGYGIFAPEPE